MNQKTNVFEPTREQRMMELRIFEQDEQNGRMVIGGSAVKFDTPQTYTFRDLSYTEIIHRGALDKTDMTRVPLRYNHNDSVIVMARTKNRSLRLTVTDADLKIEADLIDTQSNRDLYKCIQEGLIDEMSFAFVVRDGGDTWTYGKDSVTRDIYDIAQLYDVSVVDMAFYQTTNVMARSFEQLADEIGLQRRAYALELAKMKARAIYLGK